MTGVPINPPDPRGGGGVKPPQRPKISTPPQMPRIPWRGIIVALAVILAIAFVRDCFVVVQAGERAVIYSKLSGVKPYQLDEGLHFNLPIIWEPTIYNIQQRTYTMSAGGNESSRHESDQSTPEGQVPDDSLIALTSDGLPVTVDLSVRFKVDAANVWRLHQDIGPEYVDKIVRPEARSIARMAFAEYPVLDVYSGRRQVIVEQITRELRDRLALSYLILEEVLLRDIRFPPEFQSAIEQKQVAQQAAQQMVFEVQRADSERQQKIIEAQGEATAILKKAQALTAHPQLLPYEFVQQLPPNVRVVVTDSKTIINLGDVFGDTRPPARQPVPSGGEEQ
ncbi:MAG TPA: prohibitin family protein [Armatimonadota bacterium]|jgi:regulator of protease activity HflC (stomatin/prohibitin superfamily)